MPSCFIVNNMFSTPYRAILQYSSPDVFPVLYDEYIYSTEICFDPPTQSSLNKYIYIYTYIHIYISICICIYYVHICVCHISLHNYISSQSDHYLKNACTGLMLFFTLVVSVLLSVACM